jgi:Domain of unknown function (DUF4328)
VSTPTYRLQPPGALGRWLRILLLCVGGWSLVVDVVLSVWLAAHPFVMDLPSRGNDPPPIFVGEFPVWVRLLWLPSLVSQATIVLWLVWQHRMTANLWARDPNGLRITPGWAVGWWFIPIANLWKPFQAVRELWKASHGGGAWQSLRTWPVIGWWWAIWMLSLVHVWFGEHSGGVSFGTMPMGTPITPTDIITRDKWQILSLALRVFAAVFAIKIVRSVVHAQETAPPRVAMPVGQADFAMPDPPQRPDTATPG